MEEKSEQEAKFPINEKLLADSTKIKERWQLIKDRLVKIEDQKDKVSSQVYAKVKSDYQNQLQQFTTELMEKQRDIESEIETLTSTKEKIESQLEEQKHALEELEFRNSLGEFKATEFQKGAREKKEKINKFETLLTAVNSNIERYQEIFSEEMEIIEEAGAVKAPPRQKQIKEVKDVTAKVEVKEEPSAPEEEFLIDEEPQDNYFAGSDETSESKIREETQPTAKVDVANEPKESKGKHPPRIIIINGEEAGAVYPIKQTLTFGRGKSNTICIHDPKISRQHAQIKFEGGQYILRDLNSSNGTFVNNERIDEHILLHNDEIQLGDIVMQFQFQEKE
ncbi:MAG: FHA domain-containing protein [Pseudomonadota bacterium]